MARILVTGGAGYIGSHCVLALLDSGYDVVVYDSLIHGHKEIIDVLAKHRSKGKLDFVNGNILDGKDVDSVFEKYNIDAIIHFAAFIEVNESVRDPKKYHTNNVDGTRSLLDSAIRHNVKRIVFSSSAAVYGTPDYSPIDEKHPKRPINPYGETKWLVEQMLEEYSKKYDMKSARLRYFNVAGASTKEKIGEWHEPESHLIPNVLNSAIDEDFVFRLFGTDYETRDGTCVRDYVNVEDLADAHILALDYLLNDGKTDFFNLGTNEGSTVLEIVKACEEVTGKKIRLSKEGRRDGDPPSLVADHAKAERILGWKPKRTLKDSIKTAYDWQCYRKKTYGK